ncbi:hypothetical protein HN51_038814 [Arachis hypogaea]|uniref:uncharacterized protein LOC107645171 isoform X2 n=1 Tax=Arachis ipaensis TaxID=130454 RepID=UPI0007AF8659|nr:uncharacterized protein LOC107645171 isoform X2 [Arachis ipaensis]XP_025662440.1 uncharacterized protein LOC112758077 isoform X2 [Arachis hypogaea]QHN84241.1 uncharacterized protein DS421_16g526930 [Arachis hypogaea]
MGRKPSASKNSSIDKVPIAMHGNPSLERVVPQPFTGNITSPGPVDPQLVNSNCMRSPLRGPNPPVDEVVMHNARTPVQQQVNQPWLQKNTISYTKKKSKSHSSYVRRSERIKSAVVHTDKKIRGIQYIEDGDSEKDEPDAQMEQVLSELGPQVQPEPEPEHEPEPEPEPAAENSYLKSLDEKVESILRRIEALENLKFKVDGNAGPYEAPSATTNDYLSLYIESQKKVESLTAKLENALGKVEVYEKENQVLTDVLDKMKDAINASMVSNLSKATEAAVNASSQAIRTACSAKRKRDAQET